MMKEKKEMTLGEMIYSEQFQSRLDERIKECFGEYDKAVEKLKGKGQLKRNPAVRLRELGADKVERMTELYVDIIDMKSELPSTLRNCVKTICEPVLNRCLVEYMKELKGKEAGNGCEAQP